jgi:hypothetical protein
MSNIIDDYDDEAGDQAKDPVRSRMKKLEKELQEREKQLAEAAQAQRELAFLKAGVPADNPMAKYFVKGYEGDITADAIRAAAQEAGLIATEKAQDERSVQEQQAWNRLQKASRAGETSEPVTDWNAKINQARNQEEVLQILAQARQEAENI